MVKKIEIKRNSREKLLQILFLPMRAAWILIYIVFIFVVDLTLANEVSPLIRCLYHKDKQGVDYALQTLKEDPNQQYKGLSALAFAIRHFPEVIPVLVQAGAEVNPLLETEGEISPLMLAAKESKQAVSILLSLGARVDPRTVEGYTALTFAVVFNEDAIVPIFEAGADLNWRSSDDMPLLTLAAIHNPAAIEPLVQRGAKLYDESSSGGTPLMAALIRNPAAIAPLIKAGVDPNRPNSQGLTPLMVAISQNRPAAMRLLKSGANVNAIRAGWSPLMVAASCNPQMIARLVELGADLEYEQESQLGLTPLLVAVCTNPESVRELLKAGANPEAANRLGCKPLAVANLHGNVEAIQWILEYLRKIPGLDVAECKAEALRSDRKLEINKVEQWFVPDYKAAAALLWERED
ncbi:MAG: ankyrin repeat domain-containing protein [Chlamydiota bacterium]